MILHTFIQRNVGMKANDSKESKLEGMRKGAGTNGCGWVSGVARNTSVSASDVHPWTGHEGPEGEWRYSSTLPLTSALDVVGGFSAVVYFLGAFA